jgi:hypothetical protein
LGQGLSYIGKSKGGGFANHARSINVMLLEQLRRPSHEVFLT